MNIRQEWPTEQNIGNGVANDLKWVNYECRRERDIIFISADSTGEKEWLGWGGLDKLLLEPIQEAADTVLLLPVHIISGSFGIFLG